MNKAKLTAAARKAIAAAAAAGMLAGSALTTYAASPQNQSMEVTFTKTDEESTFTLSIPKKVPLSETKEVIENIGVKEMKVKDTEKVEIQVSAGISGGQVTLADIYDAGNQIHSTVSLTSGGDGIAANAVVASFTNDSINEDGEGTIPLYFSAIEDETIKAGEYSGSITFMASIK